MNGGDAKGVLEIDDVRVRYGSTIVLEGLTWDVGTSEAPVAALLGPSGCGKSTLLRAIAGLEPLAAGTITFDGRDLAGVPPHRRDFGVVFQDGQLFAGRSVADNIAYGLKMRRWPRAARTARVEEMLGLVGLAGLADRAVTELSGGQAQRVALARALAPSPRLLLLDEPLAALDRRLRDRLAVEIVEILRATSTPAVVVTHDHSEAALMGDRVAVMRAGQIVQSDSAARLWRAPVDEWTARFLGVTTVLSADVADGVARTPLGDVRVDVSGDLVTLGLRAESVVVDRYSENLENRPASVADPVSGEVILSAVLPAGPRLRVRTQAGDIDAVAHTDELVPGDRVTLRIDESRVAIIGASS